MKRPIFLVLLVAMAFFAACSSDGDATSGEGTTTTTDNTGGGTPPPPPPPPAKFTPYVIDDSSKIQEVEQGLKIYVVEEGPGDLPTAGQNILINYHGMLTDGKVFDSSFDRGAPFSFPLGQGRVIKGWDIGIAKLRYGSKAILIIPPEIGYGEYGSPPNIPPNATLVFHVELLGAF